MKYFSMFSGIGGFELGIQKANQSYREYLLQQTRGREYIRQRRDSSNNQMQWSKTKQQEHRPQDNCIGFSEIDKYATKIYQKHFPTHKNYGNARDIDPSELPDFDMLCGGFPCQSFSIAGKRKGFQDTRGTLFHEICRIVECKRPRLLFLENVKGLLSADDGRCFATILSSLDELGYSCEWQVLNSKNFGVPQNRERVFIIGHLRGEGGGQVFPLGEINKKPNETKRRGMEIQTAQCLTNRMHKMSSDDNYIRFPLKFPNRNQKEINGDYAFTVDSANTGGISNGSSIRRLTP